MGELITALFVPHDGEPKVVKMRNSVYTWQEAVGGAYTTSPIVADIICIVNIDLFKLPFNEVIRGRTFFGDVVFVRQNMIEEFESLTPEDLQMLQDKFLWKPIRPNNV